MRIEARPSISPFRQHLAPDAAKGSKAAERQQVATAALLTADKVTHQPTQSLAELGAKVLNTNFSAVGGGLPDAAWSSLPGLERMPTYKQRGNGCGTTSGAMILSYLTGRPYTQDALDQAIRKLDVFTSPRDLLEFARTQGVNAEGYNKSSWDEVEGFLNQGCPVQALIKAGDGIGSLHYVAITGVDRQRNLVRYRDPATGTDGTASLSEFEQKWNNAALGFDPYMNVYAPRGTSLPPSRFQGIEGVIIAADGATNVTKGVGAVLKEGNPGGLLQIAGGIHQAIGGAIYQGVEEAADSIEAVLSKLGVAGNILRPVTIAMRVGGRVIGHLADGFGEALSRFGSGIGKLFRGDVLGCLKDIGSGLGKAAEGIFNAAKSAGEAVLDGVAAIGRGIISFFSGW